MPVVCLHERERIEAFLRRDPWRHLYALGDLDDFFWPYTTWYALEDSGEIREAALLYSGTSLPTLLALAGEPDADSTPALPPAPASTVAADGVRPGPPGLGGSSGGEPAVASAMAELLTAMLPLLPRRLYSHLSPGCIRLLAPHYRVEPHGAHWRMGLMDPSLLARVDSADAVPLAAVDLEEIDGLYRESYPGNWFEPRMLETGFYQGIRREGKLVSVAGIHVYSATRRVAALGNVTTHPSWRGRGLARAVCARLCRELLPTVDHIGLNVHHGNAGAIACYESLGFRRILGFEEFALA